MKLDFIDNINEYGDNIVRLSEFNQREAILLRDLIHEAIIVNHQALSFNKISFVKSKDYTLTFRITAEDDGILSDDKIDFICCLSIAGYQKMLNLMQPYCLKETKGYKYLYDVDSSTDLLFSPKGEAPF
ncbi:MAG: hypothetical protein HQ463_07215 [Bacteroidetes bacterium]|nr:hypothetical protein [Bacteroidota bacterium]